jgi:hypothetical protein
MADALHVGPHEQPVRDILPAAGMARSPAATRVRDAAGHEVVLHPDRVEIRAPDGAIHLLAPGSGGLPVAELTCLALSPAGDLWVGSRQGACRCVNGRFELYAGRRWLADDQVEAIDCAADGSVMVHTASGRSQIRFPALTLADKAAHYEQLTDARHQRFGYVTGCQLDQPGDLSQTRHHIDDNDGLWTAMYAAAESFRFAATGAEEARRKARQALRALLELERLTGLPGFPARALTHRSEPDFGQPRQGEWHPSADGEWEWKGDTSSDEIDGHYFAWGITYDLVADEAERELIRGAVRRVTDRIVQNGFCLPDLDGRPTRWGVWAPERLNDDPAWRAERGLNSLELLSYLKTAHHITGDPAYEATYRALAVDRHYALNTLQQKTLPGDFSGAEDNHSDDELAFLAYYNLLRYEQDPALRALYLASLERSWQIERLEGCPLWNLTYGALTGRPCDAEAAVQALREIPMDLVDWRMTNSGRPDLVAAPATDRFGVAQARRPLPWRERPLHKWNGNPYRLDGGNDLTEECGTFWLLPYWLGRFHRLIAEA